MSLCKYCSWIAFAYSLILSRAPEARTELKIDQLCHNNNRSLPQVANPWKDHEGAKSNQNYWATELMRSCKNSTYISMFCVVFKGILYIYSAQAWSLQHEGCNSENQNALRLIEKNVFFFWAFQLNRNFVLNLRPM